MKQAIHATLRVNRQMGIDATDESSPGRFGDLRNWSWGLGAGCFFLGVEREALRCEDGDGQEEGL